MKVGKIFAAEGPLMEIMNKIMNLAVLNVCFFISCLPVFTVGAAMTALYSVALKMVRGEEAYIFSSYWKAFVSNFRQSTLCWLLLGGGGLLLAVDIRAVFCLEGGVKMVLGASTFTLLLLYCMVFFYVFPYMARFQNRLYDCLKNALFIGILNWKYTLLLFLLLVVCVGVTFWDIVFFLRAVYVWIVGGFALLAYVYSVFFRRIFGKYEENSEN